MGQYFRVNGDYNIKSKDGGTIVLDPGTSGLVYIPGNLTVAGSTTSISTTNTDIEDNIITLNKGEASSGVSLRYSGIEIDRGSSSRAALIFDEVNPTGIGSSVGTWVIASATVPGTTYAFGDSNLKLKRILTDAGEDSGDLTLIGTGTGVVKVAGTANYRLQVTDNDDIPNKDYVDYSILNNPTFQIRAPQAQDTRVIIADTQVTPNNASTGGSPAYYYAQTGYPTTESTVGFFIDGVLAANIYADRVQLQRLEFDQTEILTVGSGNDNIKFTTYGTGKVEINASLQLNNDIGSPGIVSGSHVIYSRAESTGKSGIYFVNTENNRDELVSKNRALLFSMLF
jgi:hypothetical protein